MIVHDLRINPEWPALFRDPAFWDDVRREFHQISAWPPREPGIAPLRADYYSMRAYQSLSRYRSVA